ncbi:DUF4936 family protein [Massilia cavernae]|uniref:DUF4936 family protein n=1 Tax=Massilia cavernae TaxID=2320864 RepID=A0A418XED9_9BURK|nr:DUF4936 family protein [Massilia cavernae]RJG10708.1 DUF4936 family protein [Massilia cavernae]
MFDLYVYYKVRDENADALEMYLRIMQAEVGAATGVYGEIRHRPESKDGLRTWMEIYPGAGEGFEAALKAAVQEAGILPLIEDARHAEVFVEPEPCA